MAAKEFSRVELAKYNGDNGKPHYMAIDGIVYDITDAPKKGISTKKLMELVFDRSADKEKLLAELPVVGKLAD
ncbi:cytochrome B5 [Limosilactobacillus caviae]|uniref:Cytochrome b5 n=1 Tax=Limosilactobacillus caviae TaxID=1769424 RepID=A0ABQ2C6J6_9LACO|nr:cytochrome B5 [Limosilactobacillus caviae]MCD7124865.1 cytochrome B5 [Limosilactobacillus caviae]MRH45495.1 cytochrome B5 [Limosilactobacillus reuteri]GGI62379.1 cytochrome b5 [Limosilactobacillus caviae]